MLKLENTIGDGNKWSWWLQSATQWAPVDGGARQLSWPEHHNAEHIPVQSV